ncbi:hypothetical protein [Streptomyces sp. NPDC051569]|uniref:hypothetical protein n=1 Tax=Streptomyces sp. NPDC051569 TaxID=3365661 RepID=UPI00379184B4
MSSSSASACVALDAIAANDRIRALVDAADTTDGSWPAEAYENLLLEWAAALDTKADKADKAA